MNILMVTSELAPYAKTGGLGDVVGALPKYLRRQGHDVRTFVPLYNTIKTDAGFSFQGDAFDIRLGSHQYWMRLAVNAADPGTYFVDCPALYHRGSIYTNDHDEHRRYLALGYAALKAAQIQGFAPDVLHCNDWQGGLLPLILKTRFGWDRLFAKTRTVLTIHNLNYQGIFAADTLGDTNLGDSAHLFHQDQLHTGRINYLLHGIMYAGAVSTVSPTYAREIQTREHGAGLDGFLRARQSTVVGILNGVDYEEWSPERDAHIPHRYSLSDLGPATPGQPLIAGKERDKEALLTQLGLPYVPGVPVIGIVSRLAAQKGFDLLGPVMPELLRHLGFQLVVLGSGGSSLEDMFGWLQRSFPRQVCFYRGFSNPLAHRIEAGADMFLMPSIYEPCGLNQMYSLRYGTVPIVHKTGGLADTVRPWQTDHGTRGTEGSRSAAFGGRGTGFVFEHHDTHGLSWAVRTALATYRDRSAWRRLMANGMACDFSWESQARIYELLYNRLEA